MDRDDSTYAKKYQAMVSTTSQPTKIQAVLYLHIVSHKACFLVMVRTRSTPGRWESHMC